jgi:predicted HicB family RNase H-like nuclease
MPNWSKKPPDESRNVNVLIEGKLHQRLTKMAAKHRRSLGKEILFCLEDCIDRWEAEQKKGVDSAIQRA